MSEIEFEPVHYADAVGGMAICGAPFFHPHSTACDLRFVDCESCKEIAEADGDV